MTNISGRFGEHPAAHDGQGLLDITLSPYSRMGVHLVPYRDGVWVCPSLFLSSPSRPWGGFGFGFLPLSSLPFPSASLSFYAFPILSALFFTSSSCGGLDTIVLWFAFILQFTFTIRFHYNIRYQITYYRLPSLVVSSLLYGSTPGFYCIEYYLHGFQYYFLLCLYHIAQYPYHIYVFIYDIIFFHFEREAQKKLPFRLAYQRLFLTSDTVIPSAKTLLISIVCHLLG